MPLRVQQLIGALSRSSESVEAGADAAVNRFGLGTSIGFGAFRPGAGFAGWLEDGALPTPRVCAVAVIAMLGFGVMLGGLVGPVSQPYVLAAAPTASVPAPAAAGAPADAVADVPATAITQAAPAAAPRPTASPAPTSDGSTIQPPIKNVFLIVLSGQGYDQAFGSSAPASYLSTALVPQGELLSNYYAVAQSQLANGIALISGLGPTHQIDANCPNYTELTPGSAGDNSQILGDGCVFPARTRSLPDELTGAGKTWKAYIEDIGNVAAGQPATCRHPALGSPDGDQVPKPGDGYVTWRNPFVYFHAIVDGPSCASNDVGLDQLDTDLKTPGATPSLSYIVPNRCHDGSDQPCAPGMPSAMAGTDSFLQTVVPKILASQAYKDGGMIAITFDQAPQTGPNADSSSCCDQAEYPNLATPAAPTSSASAAPAAAIPPSGATGSTGSTDAVTGPTDSAGPTDVTGPTASVIATPPPATGPDSPTGGGGKVGLLLISPYVEAGSVNSVTAYNHYSLLLSIENLFGLDRLGYTSAPALPAFDKTVYNAPAQKSAKK